MASAVTVTELMQKMEVLQNQAGDITAQVSLKQQRTDQGTKIMDSLFFRRDKTDSFLIIMTGPEAEKGNGYLRVGENFWMYRRNTRTFQHINRDENIGGSDAKAGDFEKRKFTELYKPVAETPVEEMLGQTPVYRFEVTARVNDVTYPKQIYWVERTTYLPRKVESYSLSGQLMTTSYYLKYTQIEGKYVLVKGLFVDEFEVGNKTLMEMSGISLAPIPESVFTKAYLENLSK
jgi:outer membrane lipoprotein-sorting protein